MIYAAPPLPGPHGSPAHEATAAQREAVQPAEPLAPIAGDGGIVAAAAALTSSSQDSTVLIYAAKLPCCCHYYGAVRDEENSMSCL
jgi:hypothetical protein